MSADDVLPRRPAEDVELRHGYTLYQVNSLSIWTVTHDRYTQIGHPDERLEVAWHAIIEHIYSAADPPEMSEVIKAGWRAIRDHVERDKQFYGADSRNPDALTSKGFARYWSPQPDMGPEERVTDSVSLAQILPRLRPQHRELLTALAVHEDYGLAAEALGQTRHTYATLIGHARKEFKKLWHQGETPSRPWGTDRRPRTGDRWRPSVTYRLIVRRRRLAFVPEAKPGDDSP
jgi:hypothetical protein